MDFNIDEHYQAALSDYTDRNLTFWTEKLGSEKGARFRLRNAAIDRVCREYTAGFPLTLYKPRWYQDVIKDAIRAEHYGKEEGHVLRSSRNPREDYRDGLAVFKAKVRQVALKVGIEPSRKASVSFRP